MSKQLGQEVVAWEGEADGLKKAVAHGFQEQRHMTDIVTKTNLQDYGPRCFFLIEIMDLWMLLTTVVRIYSYLFNFLIMKKVGESLTTKFARYFCWQKLGH